jgi:hypothetical protein
MKNYRWCKIIDLIGEFFAVKANVIYLFRLYGYKLDLG